jgi:hypothetical protein
MLNQTNVHKALLALFAILGLAVFLVLLNKIYPYKAVDFRVDRSQAVRIATEYLQNLGYDLQDYHVTTTTLYNRDAFAYLQQKLGFEKTVEVIRGEDANLLGYQWRITWYKNLPKSAPQQQFLVDVSTTGEMVGFQHQIPEKIDFHRPEKAHLSQEEAHQKAARFLKEQNIDISDYKEDTFTSQRFEKRTDHTFRWRKDYAKAPGSLFHVLKIQGDEVGQYFCYYELPESISLKSNYEESESALWGIISLAVFFLISIFLLAVFIKKYHEGEVSVYTASAVFVVLWTLMLILSVLFFRLRAEGSQIGELSFDYVAAALFIFMVVIGIPFLGFSGMAAWSVGESLAHGGFSQKLASTDALINRRFATLNYANSAFGGYCLGFAALGLIALLGFSGVKLLNGTVYLGGYREVMAVPLGFLVPALAAGSGSLLSELVYRPFGNLYLYKLSKRKWIAILVSSFFWELYAIWFWDINLRFSPIYLNLLLAFLIGIFFSYIFWKYDLLTVIIANFVVIGVMKTLPLITSSADTFFFYGLISFGLMAIPLVFMARGFIKKEIFEYQPETIPGHIKRISERERMAKELEIARQVQMRLLPKESPYVPGCDIAGICIPAKEVGGDYYDFIRMNERKIGVVVGDVSGKGVPAAIYMTLTKGIFQSHAGEHVSPKDVLVKVNSLMYRTIERSSFVSMFYAILDMENLTLRYSRAGHNPAIYIQCCNGHFSMLEPEGIALGLEEGEIFTDVIREQEIKLNKGDLLIFYTDGFTEAMNKHLEEYGENRLLEIVKANEDKPAREIIDAVHRDVISFVNDYPQHDDMTMVVVKID